ncbi:Glyoxylase, beta-lactamase superfamily II [Tistlia consotensis]|uniref:Glyoxylase, beta-lactamase superfamily II n=1 Tax=Tistlia consotensis USBA 355 TaxID=560819 RepID=A0A1Y6C5C5_9PROT|nr:MBL fold metallo-hydrolase [Tistlia consotensis]SMF36930.1 Glyoxylase, beta-lactamase superfamily II [Tistlia consotensis USBA 355]SNR72350.1 Glyoxylase, beta-lactamase superfamily II [Tistlia consotensis]
MQTVDLGRITIDRIVEIDLLWVDPVWFYPNITPEILARQAGWMGPGLYSAAENKLAISFHSFLIRSGGLNILVDTCNGNHKERPTMLWQHRLASDTYLRNLAAQGLSPEDIHVVMCTHLHTDHVGWNTRLENGAWVPTFPKARYIFARKEFDHYCRLQEQAPDRPIGHGSFADSVLPVVEAGLAELVETDFSLFHELDEAVGLEPSHGHTPGHVFISAKGRHGSAVITGDAIHHPIQLREPSLVNLGDIDPAQASRTRQALLARCADDRTLMLTCHFPAPTAGYVRRDGDVFDFDYRE